MARALIAEDDALIARLMREILLGAGYEVEWVADGLGVRTAACGFRPDVILLDIGLPSRNGLQVLGDLKATPELDHIPVVVVTAWWDLDVRRTALAAGAAEAIGKPFGTLELIEAVHAASAGERAVAEQVPAPTH